MAGSLERYAQWGVFGTLCTVGGEGGQAGQGCTAPEPAFSCKSISNNSYVPDSMSLSCAPPVCHQPELSASLVCPQLEPLCPQPAFYTPHVLQGMLAAFRERMPSASAQALANMLWALATLRVAPPRPLLQVRPKEA